MKTKSAKAFAELKKQHAKVLRALNATKSAGNRADVEARKLSKMIDKFPLEERELYSEVLNNYIELLETKFVFL